MYCGISKIVFVQQIQLKKTIINEMFELLAAKSSPNTMVCKQTDVCHKVCSVGEKRWCMVWNEHVVGECVTTFTAFMRFASTCVIYRSFRFVSKLMCAISENGPEDITKKDLGIWLSSNLSVSLYYEKSAQKAFAVLRMIWRTFSRITRMGFQILYGAYVRPLLEYANPVVYSRRTKNVKLIEHIQHAAKSLPASTPWTMKRLSPSLTSSPLSIVASVESLYLLTPRLNKVWPRGFPPVTQLTHGKDMGLGNTTMVTYSNYGLRHLSHPDLRICSNFTVPKIPCTFIQEHERHKGDSASDLQLS
ncbi:hypothetical protein CLF_110452 [Clonorchis sinensis]|uniref:Uncharacterized protein n=1 Tax=Clonorchis sinensis TaxID=79923 RepID=G7YTI9_CLOSI|nr:hypothetical protein CLF_110452 [Clonorchis sinensis]